MLKRTGWVTLAAILAALPVALFLAAKMAAPTWYILLMSVAQAAGMGLFAIAAGAAVLVARRGAEKGGIKAAVVTTIIVSALTSQAALYPLLRG